MAGEGRPPATLLRAAKASHGWPAFAGHDTRALAGGRRAHHRRTHDPPAMSTGTKPLLSANWFRVAAVRPRLREHVRITRQHFRGERWFVLEDLVESSVHRFLPAAQKAIGMMDGTHTLDEIWIALGALGEERPT